MQNDIITYYGYQRQDTRNIQDAEIYLSWHISDRLNRVSVQHGVGYYWQTDRWPMCDLAVVFS